MIHRFTCAPQSASPSVPSLEFEWDETEGLVTGRDAEDVRQWASAAGISIHPLPSFHTFSAEPLKSREDMAAIIGLHHVVPTELAADYPQGETTLASDVELIF